MSKYETQSTVRILRGTVITMDPQRHVISDGAIAVKDDLIVAVDKWQQIQLDYPGISAGGSPSDLIVPGYINGHQHLTGDRLIQSSIPDNLAPGEAIFSWVLPVHEQHSPDDDELSATLTLAESLSNGVTSTFEAGTVAHPERVAAAANRLGARITLGVWGWDADAEPYSWPVDEVLDRQTQLLNTDFGPLVSKWVSLVGHDLMSDQLVVQAAELARTMAAGMTFHIAPTTSDPESYLARTGKRPLVHLNDLDVLGANLAVAHAVHIDESEIELLITTGTSVVSCPWAYLRLGQGTSREFQHLKLWQRKGKIALGCDSENAGDMVDAIRTAALFAGLAKDTSVDPTIFSAHDALELITIKGAEAMGVENSLGSIETGKQADLVVHDRSRLEWIPNSSDPVLQLIWGSDGRSVRDVYVAGKQVVRDCNVVGIDLDELAPLAATTSKALQERSEVQVMPRWPMS